MFRTSEPKRATALVAVSMLGALLTMTEPASAAPLSASELPTRPVLGLAQARRVLTAAEDFARRNGWPGVIAVTDAAGYLIALERMDGSPMLASTELAPAKAKSAALFGKPTKTLEGAINSGRVAAVTGGFVEMTGGVPLVVDGHQIGAIGVSTAQPDWDESIAEAGAAILK